MTRRPAHLLIHAALVSALGLLPCVGEAADQAPEVPPRVRLQAVTVVDQNDSLVFHVKTAGPARYRTTFIERPYRVVVDLEDTLYAWRKAPLVVDRDPVRQVRGGQFRGDIARVVVELTRKVGYVVRTDDEGLAIIVPMAAAPTTNGAAAPTARSAKSRNAKATIAAVVERPEPAPGAAAVPAAPLQASQATTQAPPMKPLISLEFKDADVVNLLRTLAAEGGRNIVIGDDVKGKMSISLRNVTSELALQTILEARGLERVERDGILRIATREQLTREAEAAVKMRDVEAKLVQAGAAAQYRGPLREETLRLYYADADEVAKTLQGILGLQGGVGGQAAGPGGPIAEPLYRQPGAPGPPGEQPVSAPADVLAKGLTIRAHKPTNTLFLRLYEADLERVKKLIAESFDIPLPQVKIEARMEILERTALEQIGIQWGGAGAWTVGRQSLVGQGFDGTVPAGIAPVGMGTPPNPNLTLTNLLPISATNGLPLGGNLVNLPITALPTPGFPTTGLAFGIVGRRFNVNLALQALASQSKTHTLARPEVVTVENNKAVMTVGQEIPYATVSSAGTQIQFKEAALRLEVTPSVIREGDVTKIKLLVIVENNSPGAPTPLGSAGQPPAINKRRAETLVVMKEGDHLIIGGVMQRVSDNTIRKVPLFGDIPLLGWLFKQRQQNDTDTELVVFLTPSVLPVDRVTAGSAAPVTTPSAPPPPRR